MGELELKRKELLQLAKEIDEKIEALKKNIAEESNTEIEDLEESYTVEEDGDFDSDVNESNEPTHLNMTNSSCIGRGLDALKKSDVEENFDEYELEEEDDDPAIVGTEDSFNWKVVAGVGGALAVGAGLFLVVKRPWQASKVICHLVHIV